MLARNILKLTLPCVGLFLANSAYSTTVTFDNVGPLPRQGFTISNIDGLAFTSPLLNGVYVIDASNLYGHINLAQSGANAASLDNGPPLTIQLLGGGAFTFDSVYFGSTHALNETQSFQVRGYRSGQQVYSSTVSAWNSPHLFSANWTNIDALSVKWSGSIGYGVMDTLSYSTSSVPLPAAVWLFGSGSLGLIGIARKRRPAL